MKVIFFLTCIPLLLFADTSPFLFDRHFSPHASSFDFIFIQEELESLQSRAYHKISDKKTPVLETSTPELPTPKAAPISLRKKILFGSLRFLELGLFWEPLNATLVTVQHELFGHGYRVRDLGTQLAQVYSYKIGMPFPFGKGGGLTKMRFNSTPSMSEMLLIDIAGLESSQILAHQTAMKWLSNKSISPKQATLYTNASFELPLYVLTLNSEKDIYTQHISQTGHDIVDYLMSLNYLYPSNVSLREQLQDLRERSSFSILSNFLGFLALGAEIKYIIYGRGIDLGGHFKGPIDFYIPFYQLALTPFGPENVFGNYLALKKGAPTYFYVKEGSFSKSKYWGFGFENQGLLSLASSQIGLKFDFWSQPQVLLFTPASHDVKAYVDFPSSYFRNDYNISFDHEENAYTHDELFKPHIGAALSLIYQYKFSPETPNSLYTQIGFKTSGYLPGESVKSSPIFRFGMTLYF